MGKRLSNVVWYWLPLAAYAGTIFALSSMSHPPIPNLHWRHADKVLHALEFAGLAGLLCRGLAMGGKGLTPRAAFRGALLASVLYALADEMHQSLVPHRASDIWDFAADCAGALLGSLLYRLLALRQRPSPSTSAAPARPR